MVDDSSTVRTEVSEFLKSAGLSVTVAVDGKDGLDKLRADSGIKLVVSDVNMPNMDGLTMAEKNPRRAAQQRRQHRDADHREQPGHERTRQGGRYQGLDRQAV